MGAGKHNLAHVMEKRDCKDPDCELHNVMVIEDEDERLTAVAWQIVAIQNLNLFNLLEDATKSHTEDLRDESLAPKYP